MLRPQVLGVGSIERRVEIRAELDTEDAHVGDEARRDRRAV